MKKLIELNANCCQIQNVQCCKLRRKGAFRWITVTPIQEHGFALTKSEFRDALRIRYNKQLQGMSSKSPCGQKYDLNRAMNCKRGRFLVMRHNNVRDFEVNLMKTIQNDVQIGPALQKMDNERIDGCTGMKQGPIYELEGLATMAKCFLRHSFNKCKC